MSSLYPRPKEWIKRDKKKYGPYNKQPAPHWVNVVLSKVYPRFVIVTESYYAYNEPQRMMYDRKSKDFTLFQPNVDQKGWVEAMNLRYGWFGNPDKFTLTGERFLA